MRPKFISFNKCRLLLSSTAANTMPTCATLKVDEAVLKSLANSLNVGKNPETLVQLNKSDFERVLTGIISRRQGKIIDVVYQQGIRPRVQSGHRPETYQTREYYDVEKAEQHSYRLGKLKLERVGNLKIKHSAQVSQPVNEIRSIPMVERPLMSDFGPAVASRDPVLAEPYVSGERMNMNQCPKRDYRFPGYKSARAVETMLEISSWKAVEMNKLMKFTTAPRPVSDEGPHKFRCRTFVLRGKAQRSALEIFFTGRRLMGARLPNPTRMTRPRPFSQVGGHPNSLQPTEDGSMLIKPALPLELEFYTIMEQARAGVVSVDESDADLDEKTLDSMRNLYRLSRYIPRFYGTLKLQDTEGTEGSSPLQSMATGRFGKKIKAPAKDRLFSSSSSTSAYS
ncbi:hypothetical protein D9757_000350 [Collybiopsis confluens]|uniref:Uncharacterized protein n=1 Tax=Collybiopsis confluens TaxID=2823264 RepID=A0A8H5I328_9AGAR|nr:hypothetical protein D9757_000350 [Collybiopsis confluens]